MDSLLSKAQRCGRLADQLAKYGMYDEAVEQLEKSMDFLKQLKSNVTTNSNSSNINVEMEQIDRKMRRFSIKRIEDAKKKTQLENALKNKETDAPVLIQTNNGTNMQGYHKLGKDDKSLIEELTTINSEYRKVNLYLSNEIDHLKKENAYLKQELFKYIKACEDDSSAVEASSSCGVVSNNTSKLLDTNCTNSKVSANANINKSNIIDDDQDDKQQEYNTVDLTKYINSEDSDSDDSCHNNMPPLEFTIDS